MENWIVLPRVGLGALRYGMSPQDVDALGIYGEAVRSGGDRIPDDILRDTLAQLGDGLSEDEKRDLLALYAEQGPDAGSMTEVRGTHGLVLTYQDGRLAEILLSGNHASASLDGIALFSTEPEALLSALETRNREPGRYRDREAAFDTLAMSLYGFSVLVSDTDIEALAPDDPRAIDRTVTLRATPYISGEPGYRLISVR